MKNSKGNLIISAVLFGMYLIYNIAYCLGVVMAKGTILKSGIFNIQNGLIFVVLLSNLIVSISTFKRGKKC